MHTVLIIQHTAYSAPAYFLTFLEQHGIAANIIRLHEGDALPGQLHGYSGLALFGGAMSVNDTELYDWIQPELDLVRLAVQQDVPVIGHCLGGQMLARALGGRVCRAPVPEMGWHPLQHEDGSTASWLGEAVSPQVFQWHGDTFELPEGAVLLASSRWCRNQMFSYRGKHIGMQFHCEMTDALIREWLLEAGHEIDRHDLPSVMPSPVIASATAGYLPGSQQLAANIYRQWIRQFPPRAI